MALDPISSAIETAVATADPTSAIAETLDIAADTAIVTPEESIVTPTGDTPAAAIEAVVSPSSGVAAADTAAKAAAALEAAKPVDELTKELEALGLKAPKDGERENRLPYGRVTKIVGNAIKKTTEKFQAQVTEVTERATKAETQLATYSKVDKLIDTDPDRYVGMLAALHPEKYGKFVQAGKAAPVAGPAAATPAAGRSKPQPDATFPDGTKGYSDAGFEDLLKWNREEGAREANAQMQAEFDKRLGPIEKERASARMIQERLPGVQNRLEKAKKRWGPLFEADYNKANEGKSEILKLMKANDGEDGRPFLSFEDCTAEILLPLMQKSRDDMRTGILEELKGRPAAAVRTPASPAKAGVDAGPKTMEDVIRESIRSLK